MAKKTTKKAATVAKGGRKTPRKVVRAGVSQVRFGVHGMTKIVNAIGKAGLESEFNNTIGSKHQFVMVKRESLKKIKDFVDSRPELSGLAADIRKCDCPDDDPYCFYI